MLPPTMIQDLLAERFPQMAQGGKYRLESEALKIGLQVMQQQQQAQEEAVKNLEAQNKQGRAELMKGGGRDVVFNRPRTAPTAAAAPQGPPRGGRSVLSALLAKESESDGQSTGSSSLLTGEEVTRCQA